MKYYIGCSGYFYLHWNKIFYPENLKKSLWFDYYSKFFNTVEINSTFYSMPDDKKIKSWYKSSKNDFVFSIKANKVITHIKRLKNIGDTLNNFVNIIKNLNEKLGYILFQFPPSFKYSDENIKNIMDLPEKISVIEFRDKSWYNKNIFNDIISKNIHIACVSSMDMPFIIPDDNVVYFRLHGNENGYATDYSNEKLKYYYDNIFNGNKNEIYVYFNNDYYGYAPKNALEFIKIANKKS